MDAYDFAIAGALILKTIEGDHCRIIGTKIVVPLPISLFICCAFISCKFATVTFIIVVIVSLSSMVGAHRLV